MNLFFSRFLSFVFFAFSFLIVKANDKNMSLDSYVSNYNSTLYNNPIEVISNAEFLIRNADNKKKIAEAYLLLAFANFYAGKNDIALENVAIANTEALNFSDDYLIDLSEFLLQRIYQRYNLYDFSEQYIAKNHSDYGITIKSLQYFNQGNFEKCISTLLQKGKLTVEDNLTLSKAYFKKHQYQKAFNLLQSLEKDSSFGIYFKTRIELFLGEYYFDIRDTNNAVNHYKNALEFAKKINNPYLIADAYYNLGSLYLAKHSIDEFNIYREKYDSILSKNILINQKINNEVFHHQLKVIQLNQEKDESLYKTIIIISITSFLLLLSVYIFLLNKKKEKLTLVSSIVKTIQDSRNENIIEENENIVKSLQKTDLLSKDKEYAILQKLDSFEKTNKFLFKNVSLGLIASQLDTNTKYLSDVINRHKKKNFNTYINELRIKYILNKLTTDSNYLNYKISYLAEECGFSSHSSFVSAFKSYTGTTPTVFINAITQTNKI